MKKLALALTLATLSVPAMFAKTPSKPVANHNQTTTQTTTKSKVRKHRRHSSKKSQTTKLVPKAK